MALPQPGQEFEGRYRVVEHIGTGGFAEVYKATDASGRAVAIKILVPLQAEWAQNDPIVERFEREGHLLGQLKNEHTVTMIEMGRTADGVSPYIVFEFVDGADLAQILDQRGPLPADRVVTILKQVCSALAEAHELGVMHRDIKPANIMVYEHLGVQGNVKLLDFGIAKPTEGLDSRQDLTSAGMVLGTPRYMAPEQFTGARAAPPSDIYSLGLVAYELVTGKMAVDAETTTGIFRQQLSQEEFKLPRDANIPPGLRRVIAKMTRKARGERYQTVQEVLADLDNLDAVALRPAPMRAVRKGGNRKLFVAAALLLVLVVAAGFTLVAVLSSGGGAEAGEISPPTPDVPAEPVARLAPKVERISVKAPEPEPDPPEVVPDEPDEPDEPTEPTEPDEPDEPTEPEEPAGTTGAPTDKPKPADAMDIPPPPDDIEPLELGSSAAAKNVATRALTMGDWEKVIAACKPYGHEMTFCARWLADAYRSRGNIDQACYWFEVVGQEKTGLNCPHEQKKGSR